MKNFHFISWLAKVTGFKSCTSNSSHCQRSLLRVWERKRKEQQSPRQKVGMGSLCCTVGWDWITSLPLKLTASGNCEPIASILTWHSPQTHVNHRWFQRQLLTASILYPLSYVKWIGTWVYFETEVNFW